MSETQRQLNALARCFLGGMTASHIDMPTINVSLLSTCGERAAWIMGYDLMRDAAKTVEILDDAFAAGVQAAKAGQLRTDCNLTGYCKTSWQLGYDAWKRDEPVRQAFREKQQKQRGDDEN